MGFRYPPKDVFYWLPACRTCKYGEGLDGVECQYWKQHHRITQGYDEKGKIVCEPYEERQKK